MVGQHWIMDCLCLFVPYRWTLGSCCMTLSVAKCPPGVSPLSGYLPSSLLCSSVLQFCTLFLSSSRRVWHFGHWMLWWISKNLIFRKTSINFLWPVYVCYGFVPSFPAAYQQQRSYMNVIITRVIWGRLPRGLVGRGRDYSTYRVPSLEASALRNPKL